MKANLLHSYYHPQVIMQNINTTLKTKTDNLQKWATFTYFGTEAKAIRKLP
jgi:hypothetical protein